MTAAKITHAHLLLHDHKALLVTEIGLYDVMTVPQADARLAESGQRAVWPEEPGLAVLHDPPAPWETWGNVHPSGMGWFRSLSDAEASWQVPARTQLIHVWQDDAGIHVEDVTP